MMNKDLIHQLLLSHLQLLQLTITFIQEPLLLHTLTQMLKLLLKVQTVQSTQREPSIHQPLHQHHQLLLKVQTVQSTQREPSIHQPPHQHHQHLLKVQTVPSIQNQPLLPNHKIFQTNGQQDFHQREFELCEMFTTLKNKYLSF